jgi:DNA polymerase-4
MGRSADVPRLRAEIGRDGNAIGGDVNADHGAADSADHSADDSGCTILHVDMDAFFASVEIRRRPELRGRPVLVGGDVRGVVAAASYEARRFGVRSAMSMMQAKRLCPHAVVLPPDRAAYSAASAQVMAILRGVTPVVEPLSLDEAFLDVSGAIRLLGRPAEIGARIREQVSTTLGLTCSVGVASNKYVAKLASARCKPDGLLVVPADGVLNFLHPLPVTVLWGVGRRTAEPLHRLGIRTVGELAQTPIQLLRRAVGDAVGDHLAALAAGIDPRPVHDADAEKSISADRTMNLDLTETVDVNRELLRLSGDVAERLRQRSLVARTVGIKIRFADFHTVTRVRTLPEAIDSTTVLHREAMELYCALRLDRPRIRLVGVKAAGLRPAGDSNEQLSFDEPPSSSALDHATDSVKAKFGPNAVGFGTLLRPGASMARASVQRDPGSH